MIRIRYRASAVVALQANKADENTPMHPLIVDDHPLFRDALATAIRLA